MSDNPETCLQNDTIVVDYDCEPDIIHYASIEFTTAQQERRKPMWSWWITWEAFW